jgi:hypothetical protein
MVESSLHRITLNAIRSFNPRQRYTHEQHHLHHWLDRRRRRHPVVLRAALKRQAITAGIAPSIDAHDSPLNVSDFLMASVKDSADLFVRCRVDKSRAIQSP